MKTLALLALVLVVSSCAHSEWCEDSMSNQSHTTKVTTLVDSVNTNQAAIQRDVTIKEIQRRLNILGHRSGPVDGIVGPITTSALTRFQISTGININGKVNKATVNALNINDETLKTNNL